MDTYEGTRGSVGFVDDLKAKAAAAQTRTPDPLADKCWGLEDGGDPVLSVETAKGRVHITNYDYDEDGDAVVGFYLDRDVAEYLRDRLNDAFALLDAQARK